MNRVVIVLGKCQMCEITLQNYRIRKKLCAVFAVRNWPI